MDEPRARPRSAEAHARVRSPRGAGAALRLDHCVISVTDWKRSNAFYRDVLGAEVIEHPEGRVAYRFGDQQLNVHGPDPAYERLVARLPVQPGNSDLCFVWPGPIEDAIAHLGERGVAIEAGPLTRHGGRDRGSSVYFRDPDGSLLELISYEEPRPRGSR